MTKTPVAGELSWLLDNLVIGVDHVREVVILSRDGLTLGTSEGLSREDAEHLCALAAAVQSLARGAGRHFQRGGVRQTIIEMTSAFLFITAAGHGTCIAVLTSADADVSLVAYEMAILVKRVGQHLVADPRVPGQETVAG
jgi:predicted regulator of Ras-like GTPase activity (Roadblock/LC7/MglB family)